MGHARRIQTGRYPVIESGLLRTAASGNNQGILSIWFCKAAGLIHFSASELNIYRKVIRKDRICFRFGCHFFALRNGNSCCHSTFVFFFFYFILINNVYKSSEFFFIFQFTDDEEYNSEQGPSADHYPFLRHQ